MIGGRQEPSSGGRLNPLVGCQPGPQLIGGWKGVQLAFEAGQKVKLHKAMAVGCVCERKAEDLRVVLGLLEPIAGGPVAGLCLDHGDGHVGPVTQQIVGSLARPSTRAGAGDDDAAIGERYLLAQTMRLVVPTSLLQLWDDQPTAGIGFVWHRQFQINVQKLWPRREHGLMSRQEMILLARVTTLETTAGGPEAARLARPEEDPQAVATGASSCFSRPPRNHSHEPSFVWKLSM